MNFVKTILCLLPAGMLLIGCKDEGTKALPPAPSSVAQTLAWLQGRTLTVQKAGFYGALTVNNNTTINWIDTTDKAEPLVKETVRELGNWNLRLGTDSSIVVNSKGDSYTGYYKVDDQPQEGETPGIRLRVTYPDPTFSFGGSEPMEVTYTYLVKGIDAKEMLLELPREINRQKLLALMEVR
ncbi:MAG: hypothetical protein GXC78_01310 [Chitinophagaceae bacterium]|nr:hypothetical protein [Chitinophagaceae bacterium]